LCFKVQLK
jgi:hypothetical protein